MRTILILLSLVMGFQANAARPKMPRMSPLKAICEGLIAKAEANCDEAMCEQYKEDSGEPECPTEHDGDYMEGLQICVWDGEMPDLIKEWNKHHRFQIKNCDDL
jgi:hypothetical protein